MNTYKCYFNRLVMEVTEETALKARDHAQKRWDIQDKDAHKITVVRLNEDGTPDVHAM